MEEETLMNNPNPEMLLEEWQERLGLQDWAIVLRYDCKFEDLETDDSCRRNIMEQ